ncbi:MULTISPECIES: Uma2 family endonuclease [unclassified Microcoleus]|uniref:Uma2 family endonuclease n=1 Tax=unclassified Microcoleus TaxID=2642155 RepID=UPI001D7D1DBD|nr:MULTISPECIES: Uma2 family endonuclease [unclassified Microcoleus]MCC3419485.1 Uma2 family endonuclease [Microcoleus sp. PH2017_07_MST_O_A]MCC3432898.1 Uma2 family endonuclease [Microcoleus sp. PH2017_04_SCI_O_A]MCC3466779.1 Uma2 family endonuclease [Microcoleus sp. PH2017_06_SFM_O_A]MCC3505675.1 Uma2 family endonuclease [Microcoleus sp. PH2017_19_SFW_U_A]MCC3513125.1 Uma2 family endonuclease [Microcoleus sp. PH2017_17_BER_D_A]TAE64156.1 MAG: Uma2 family endonuclease [Oscillatoriales cyanob
MIVIAPVLKPISQIQLTPGSVVTIPNITWLEFESILEELGEKRSARVAYSKETLEIMVPLPEHERPTDLISDIVKILLKSAGRRYEPFGSTTFKREGAAGIEPDACFYILNYQRMISRRRLLPDDPPPDLAIETDVASKTTLDAYLAIEVPEVWVYDSGRLRIYLLQEGEYVESDISPNFPGIAIAKLIPSTVERALQVGSCQALEEFESAIAR